MRLSEVLPWQNDSMDLVAELARFNPDPALAEWMAATLLQAQNDAAQLKLAKLKIQALTLELAYHKPLKFGAKAEAFTSEQRDLFTASSEEDLSAMQAELEQLSPAAPRAKAKPTGRLLICRVSNIDTNQNRAPAASAARLWCKSAKMSANSSMSNRYASLSIVISVRNTLAALAKLSLPLRFPLPSSTVAWQRLACMPGS
jgi:hypothetical protein